MKRNEKIIISVILLILIFIIAGIAVYFFTDLFKSNKVLFYKYLAKNSNVISKYVEDTTKNDLEYIKQNKYSTTGTISFDLVSNNQDIANQTVPARNFNIEYNMQADSINNKDSLQAKLKYLDTDLFELKYAHNNDLYGITSSEVIINKYITFENNNLKELATKYGIADVSSIPDKIQMQNLSELFNLTRGANTIYF